MRICIAIVLLILPCLLFSQDITFKYQNDDSLYVSVPVKNDTEKIVIEKTKQLKKFSLTVKNLLPKNKIIVQDPDGVEIDPYPTGDAEQPFTSLTAINDKYITLILVDDKGEKKTFAKFIVLSKLPDAGIDVTKDLSAWLGQTNEVCVPCKYNGNALIYDFSSNSVTDRNSIKWAKKFKFTNGRPLVGKPFSFTVNNINPFRDSVIISNETTSYNTDVPDLFTKAFFSPGKSSNDDKDQAQILADVFAMGEQLEAIITALKNSKECQNICQIIQKAKDAFENHFKTYKYDPSKQTLVTFLQGRLQKIPDVYKERVTLVMNQYETFYKSKNYFNYNIPQIQNVDEYIFTLSIISKKDAHLSTIVDHQPISVRTVGGFKVDFSSGLFMTRLRDTRISLKPDSSVIRNTYGGDSIVFNRRNQIIQQTDNKKLDFGVSALMHFYPRISPSFNLGLSLGAGLSIGPDPAIRYLGGGSLLIGKTGRLILSYGCAAGFVDELDDTYQNLQFVSTGDKKSLIKKVFKTKGFWGLTFNIPLFKAKVVTGETKTEEPKEEAPKEEPKEEAKK